MTPVFFPGLPAVCDAIVAHSDPAELAAAIVEPFRELIGGGEPGLVVLDEQGPRLLGRPSPALEELARRDEVRAACQGAEATTQLAGALVLPLRSPRKRLGALLIADVAHPPVELLEEVAALLALALEAVTNQRRALDAQAELALERDRLALLLEVGAAVTRHLELGPLLESIQASLAPRMECEWVSVTLPASADEGLIVHALRFAGQGLVREGERIPWEDAHNWDAVAQGEAILITDADDERLQGDFYERLRAEGLCNGVIVPLLAQGEVIGSLDVATRRCDAYSECDVHLLRAVAQQVAVAVKNALAYEEIQRLRDRLAEEKRALEADLGRGRGSQAILGQSSALEAARAAARQVAPTDASVLITGETGTGKELFARAIHEQSRRRDQPFVVVNCAAIPSGLLESELFGHERGAFTGANARRIGRFELAHGGTLFLDEVGEIPLELQPKLLRVLQDLRFERIGGSQTQSVDVRVIAATNRDLEAMVGEGRFRGDLFYRLNVFPLELPPLRERREDVALLARHFMGQASRRLGRSVTRLPAATLAALEAHPWPGNVRELANAVERAVILSPERELATPPGLATSAAPEVALAPDAPSELRTFAEWERWVLLQALEASDWVVGGPEGAAARLGLRRTTLQSRIKRLGIERPSRAR